MKRWMIVVSLVMVVSAVHAERTYRDFTDVQGRTIRGRVVAFDAAKGSVKFERDNRKTVSVPIKIFCEKDQAFIRDGEIMRLFANESKFKISVKRNEEDNEEKSGLDNNVDYDAEDTNYWIELENRTGAELKGVTMEYCIFYEQEDAEKISHECLKGVKSGKIDIGDLKPKAKKSYPTEAVTTYKAELSSERHFTSGAKNVHKGEVHGICVRVYLKVPGAGQETREFCLPDTLMKKQSWVTSSVDVGMN